jgi:hypothetical protein
MLGVYFGQALADKGTRGQLIAELAGRLLAAEEGIRRGFLNCVAASPLLNGRSFVDPLALAGPRIISSAKSSKSTKVSRLSQSRLRIRRCGGLRICEGGVNVCVERSNDGGKILGEGNHVDQRRRNRLISC